jgi:hypothetical protein
MFVCILQLKPPGIEKLINRVLECEGEATHWSLKDRLVLVNDVLDGFAAAGTSCNMFYVAISRSKPVVSEQQVVLVSGMPCEYTGLPLHIRLMRCCLLPHVRTACLVFTWPRMSNSSLQIAHITAGFCTSACSCRR